MYKPSHFSMDELADQHALIEANHFGVLVAQGDDGLLATHVPLMLRRDEGRLGTLYTHIARVNAQAGLEGREMLAIFSGPHAYVSPSWFLEREINVPTWNYTAVHCRGVMEACPGPAIALLQSMVVAHERGRVGGWSMDELDVRARESLAAGVFALRMEIRHIEGIQKLSQNKPRLERARVIAGLKADGAHGVASLMQGNLDRI